MMKQIIYIAILALFCGNVYSQETPGAAQSQKILLLNGTAHLGNGKKINRSAIAMENGKITMVVNALTHTLDLTKYDTVIDVKDQHVYPSFIAANSTLGLQEIGAVRATKDQSEVGKFNPHVRSLIAYNTDSDVTTTVRTNGVLIGQITPRGGTISGVSSVVQFDAWNWEDAVIKTDDGIHMKWPNDFSQSGWWAEPGETKKNSKYVSNVKAIKDFFNEAKAYCSIDKYDEVDLRYEAMRGVFDGSKRLYVEASYAKQISDVINFKREYHIENLVLKGGYDSWMVAERLKENHIPVMLQRTHSLPLRPEDDIDMPYKLPKILQDAGVLYCLQNAGDMEQMGTRNLPFYAGTAVAYGLEYEEAVSAISLNTAKIMGMEDRVGSIEVGKDATLFISSGDALEMKTNQLTMAFVNGRVMSLDNHQIRNYLKYKEKYGLE